MNPAAWSLSPERIEQWLNNPWVVRGVNALAVVVFAAVLAHWTWEALAPAPVVVSATKASKPPVPVAMDVQAIQGAAPFGSAPQSSATAVQNLPLSSLNLVLTGIIATGHGGMALIKVEGQPETPFRVGEEILPGAVLRGVYPDRVVIARRGREESLLLEGPKSVDVSVPTIPGVSPSPAMPRGAPEYAVPRALVQQQMQNPQRMGQDISVVPFPSGGFLVRDVKPGSVYQRFGVRAGDVIRSVNGTPVNNLNDAMRAYQQAMQSKAPVRVDILRHGRVEQLEYQLE